MAKLYPSSDLIFCVFTTSKGKLKRFLHFFFNINKSFVSIRIRFVLRGMLD